MINENKAMIVEAIKENGGIRINFRHYGDSSLNREDVLNLLTSALPMAIKMNIQGMEHKEQAEVLRRVIEHIENEVFDIKSFEDLSVEEENNKN